MALRKCTKNEALAAAKKYGCEDEHDFKSHVIGNFQSISYYDIFIESSTREIFIGDKNGKNLQPTGVEL